MPATMDLVTSLYMFNGMDSGYGTYGHYPTHTWAKSSITVDPSDYDGVTAAYFEFHAYCENNASVILTDGSTDLVTVTNPDFYTLYREAFTWPSTSKTLSVKTTVSASGDYIEIYFARLIIVQEKATKTVIQIPFVDGNGSDYDLNDADDTISMPPYWDAYYNNDTWMEDYYNGSGVLQRVLGGKWKYVAEHWSNISAVEFEGVIASTDWGSAGSPYNSIGLADNGSLVSGSQIDAAQGTGVSTRVSLNTSTLVDGHYYYPIFKGIRGTGAYDYEGGGCARSAIYLYITGGLEKLELSYMLTAGIRHRGEWEYSYKNFPVRVPVHLLSNISRMYLSTEYMTDTLATMNIQDIGDSDDYANTPIRSIQVSLPVVASWTTQEDPLFYFGDHRYYSDDWSYLYLRMKMLRAILLLEQTKLANLSANVHYVSSGAKQADYSNDSPSADTWYTILDYSGAGILESVRGSYNRTSDVSFRITIDGGTAQIVTGADMSRLSQYLSTAKFSTSLKVEVRGNS